MTIALVGVAAGFLLAAYLLLERGYTDMLNRTEDALGRCRYPQTSGPAPEDGG